MTKKRIEAFILFLLLTPFLSKAQKQSSFVTEVNECYSKTEFEDILYRIQNEKECYIGLKFPEFLLQDLNGNDISNATIKNKVTVINFWFTACPPCLEEIPHFNKLIKQTKGDDIIFLAPSTDNEKTINNFIKQYGALESIVLPNAESFLRNTLASKSGFPTTIVVDKNGIIREYYSGGIIDFDKFTHTIKTTNEISSTKK